MIRQDQRNTTNRDQRNTTNRLDRSNDARQAPPDRDGEFSRLLQVRRLEVRNVPFRGFDSPPGRF